MCGFIGAWGLQGPLDGCTLSQESLGRLAHRGPDGEGWFERPRLRMGFRRLAIIDREGGAQPLHAGEGGLHLTLNGEVYNHHALRAQLRGEHAFSSAVDTEVVLHGYARWGDGVLERLRGMFALALVDEARGRVLLARDRAGQKPLYYTRRGGALLWSSELAPLLDGVERPPLDRQALNDYLRFGYVPAPRTMWAGIYKLPAGSALRVEADGEARLWRWWLPNLLPQAPRIPEADEVRRWEVAVRDALDLSVRLRLETEAPLGFLLSGGIDSAGVFALGAQSLGSTQARAFTMSVGDPSLDEADRAASLARRYLAHHHVQRLDADEADDLSAVIRRCEEPLATDALLPTDRVFAFAKRGGITTVLSGEGADEVFAGYAKFSAALGSAHTDPESAWSRLGATPLARYLAREEFCFPTLDDRQALLGPDANDEGYAWLEDLLQPLDPLGQMLAAECLLRLPDRINLRLDRLSMAYGVEARAPFMDHHLIDLALRVPHALRRRAGQSKWILRRALAADLTDDILRAPKAPFRAPDAWFTRGPDPLSLDEVQEAGLVQPDAYLALLRRDDPQAHEQRYNLLVLHRWFYGTYLPGPALAAA
jgi:asparagine synthase (glutamine-hydrolysing)